MSPAAAHWCHVKGPSVVRRDRHPMCHGSSDQGCKFTGHEWQTFLRDHRLVSSMSRRGNSHNNEVAESFVQLLKRERIHSRFYDTRDDARIDVFNYIEMFYNSKRRHSSPAGLSPADVEQQPSQWLKSV